MTEVRLEGGWFVAYVDGVRVGRFSDEARAKKAAERMEAPLKRVSRGPAFTARVPKKGAGT